MSSVHHAKAVPSFSVPFYTRPANADGHPVTPPESPHEPMTKPKKQPSRIRLPKLKKPHLSRSSSTMSQGSATPAISDEPVQVVPNTHDIPPLPTSMPLNFRDASQVKEPFPIVLPESPPISPRSSAPRKSRPTLMRFHSANDAVTRSTQEANMSETTNQYMRRLKTVPLSVENLKAPSSTMHLQVIEDAPRLLPSPDLHDGRILASTSEAYFTVHDPVTGISPCENHSVISSYLEPTDPTLVKSPKRLGIRPLPIRAHTFNAIPQEKQNSDDGHQRSHTMHSTVRFQKRGSRDRSSTFPTESDWLSGTMQYCEDWLQGVETDQRRCQIVETPEFEYSSDDPDAEADVKFATVIQTTRPKIVDVSRHCSFMPAQSDDDDGGKDEEVEIQETHVGLRTPSQEYHERSAFSPWDSPNRDSYATTCTDATELPVLVSPALPAQNPARRNRQLKRNEETIADEIKPETRSLTELDSEDVSSQSAAAESSSSPPQTLKSASPSISPMDSYFSLPSSSRTTATSISSNVVHSVHANPKVSKADSPKIPISIFNPNQSPPSQPPRPNPVTSASSINDLDWILAHLTSAINSFPRDILLLSSPAIMRLCALSANSQSADLPLTLLRRIFPTTEPLLLSALAAAIISHDFLVSYSTASLPPVEVMADVPTSPPTTAKSPILSGPTPSSHLHPTSFSNRVAAALSNNTNVPTQPDVNISRISPPVEDIPPKARTTLGIQAPFLAPKTGRQASYTTVASGSDGSTPTVTGATTPTPVPALVPATQNADSIFGRRPSVEDQANRKRLMHILAAGFNVVVDDLVDAVVRAGSENPMGENMGMGGVSQDKDFVRRVTTVVVLGCGVGSI